MTTPGIALDELREDLARRGLEIRETHISLVALGRADVWKVKKPVSLGFLDFGSIAKRRAACEAEVELNRRLAPDVYHGVVPVVRHAGGYRFGGDGEPLEWAVHMRRLPDARRADVLLEEGGLDADHVVQIAEKLAGFHATARCDAETARWGTPEAVEISIVENFEQTRGTLDAYLTPAQVREIEGRQRAFLSANRERFRARIEQGRVRDGHGDLRLEHVYLSTDGIRVVDCIEFSDRLRYGDVCVDLAFLAMDLAWHGRVDLAETLVAAYAAAANDYDLYPLLDFYESYRAFVRGKIASFLVADSEQHAGSRERVRADAHRYFLLALASERRPLLAPRLIAVGGWIAAGKTTVAAALGRRLQAPVVSADPTRKFLLGVAPTTPVRESAFAGAYSSAASRAVYTEVMRRGRAVLESGRSVILDASFRSREGRRLARELAASLGVPFAFLECTADAQELRRRLLQRRRESGTSDGRLEIFDDFVRRWEPVDELPAEEHLILDTGRPLDEVLDQAAAHLGIEKIQPA